MDSVQLEYAQKRIRIPSGKTVTQQMPVAPAALMSGCGAIGRKGVSPAAKTAKAVWVNSTISETPAILPPGRNDELLS